MIVKKKLNDTYWTLDIDDVFPAYFDEVIVSCLKYNRKIPLFMGKSREDFEDAYLASKITQWKVLSMECYATGDGDKWEMKATLCYYNYTMTVVARPYNDLDFFIDK